MATTERMEGPGLTIAPPELPSTPSAASGRVAGVAASDADVLLEELRERPGSFDFFQAVRLLQRLQPEREPVGYFGDPANEAVRFSVPPSIGFPSSAIQALEMSEGGAAQMEVNFLGLTGPQGVLPHHYTLLAAERKRAKDTALASFLDLFHHRLLSLFYRAWEKHRFAVLFENDGTDPLREHLLDLVGIGSSACRDRLPLSDDALVFYAGLLTPQTRGAAALQQLLEEYFGVPVEVEQFVGGWYRLPPSDQCALGEEGSASSRLGHGAVAGDEVWDQQAKVRIRLGPLKREQYDDFLPTGSAYESLRALVRFYSHDQFDFELRLVLREDDVPGYVLGAEMPQPLGWASWIRTAPLGRDADDTLLRL